MKFSSGNKIQEHNMQGCKSQGYKSQEYKSQGYKAQEPKYNRFSAKVRYLFAGALGTVALIALTGCGAGGEKTAEGMSALQEFNYQTALTSFEQALESGENERVAKRGMGIAYMGLADYENAITSFTEALNASSGFIQSMDYDMNFYLAAAYVKAEQYQEAEQVYDSILALKKDEEAYFLRGSVRLARGNYEGAKEDFDKVISMDSANYNRLIEIYRALESYGYKEVGKSYLENAMQSAGDRMNDFDSGRIYYYLGEYQKACVALERAREKGDAESYLYLGRSYEATGDYNYASSVYNSWIAKDTGNAEIYNQLGLCELSMGDYKSALEAFQAGMQTQDSSMMQVLSFNEIVAYEYLEEYQQAFSLIEGYLKNYPDDAAARRERDFLSTR